MKRDVDLKRIYISLETRFEEKTMGHNRGPISEKRKEEKET